MSQTQNYLHFYYMQTKNAMIHGLCTSNLQWSLAEKNYREVMEKNRLAIVCLKNCHGKFNKNVMGKFAC